MEREDIDKILDEYLSEYHSRIVKDYIQELEDKIDKAIEYIEEKAPQSLCLPNGVYDMRRIDKTELLNILKGSDKE